MKKIILIFNLSYIFINFCFSQTSVWKVEGENNTIYIGGTIHILSSQDYPLPFQFDSIYDLSDKIVLEADLQKAESPEYAQKIGLMAMYQDDRTLKTVLSNEVYNLLETECSKYSISLSEISKFKPSMVLLIYSITKMQQSGDTVAGVDKYYLTKAINDSKRLLFLETVESQMELLFPDTDENENQMVLQFFNDVGKMDVLGKDFKMEWLNGKDKILINLQKDMKKDYPEVYKKMIIDRNVNWVSQIESYFVDNDIEFVLVGAMHLPGNKGVIKLLKNKGYKVKQL